MASVNFPKSYPESKIVTCNFVDPSTGEILYKSCKEVRVRCDHSIENYIKTLFESYCRGLRQRNLAFLIDVTDIQKPLDLDFTT